MRSMNPVTVCGGIIGLTLSAGVASVTVLDCRPASTVAEAACQEITAFGGTPEQVKICLDAVEIGTFIDAIALHDLATDGFDAGDAGARKVSAPCMTIAGHCLSQAQIDYGAHAVLNRRRILDAGGQ